MLSRFQIALSLIALVGNFQVRAEDWPMFGRDQTRNAVSPEKNPPTWWQIPERDRDGKVLAPSKNIRWSTTLNDAGGYGHTYGDPVVVDGMVWIGTMQPNPDAAVLHSIDEKTGKILYRYVSPRLDWKMGQEAPSDWPRKSMACSPLIEGDRVWFTTNRCEVVCLDIGPLKKRQGDPCEVWKVDMRKDLAVSPRGSLLDYRLCSIASYKNLIYVITGNGVGSGDDVGKVVSPDAPSLVCFDKASGKVVWKDNSPGKGILFSQYASPTVIAVKGQAQVVAPEGDGWVRSFDATTGKSLWKFDTNPPDTKYDLTKPGESTRNYLPATAVFHENRLYIGNGREPEQYSGPAWLYCIDPSRTGDISPYLSDGPGKSKPNPNSGMIWKFGGVDERTKDNIFGITVSNVAIDKGLVVASSLDGFIHCLDAQTGRHYWMQDVRGGLFGSPLIVW